MLLKKNPIFFSLLLLCILFISLYSNNGFLEKNIQPKDFYLYFSVIPLLAALIYSGIKGKNKWQVSISIVDLAVLFYYFYCLVRILFTDHISLYNVEFINQTLLVTLYFSIKLTYKDFNSEFFKKHYKALLTGIFVLISLNALYGIFQYTSVFAPSNANFKLGGSFGNPGPYSNFLILLTPFCYPVLLNKKSHSGTTYFLAFSALVLTVIVLPMTQARTAWICFVFSLVAYLFLFYPQPEKIKILLRSKLLKLGLVIILILGSTWVLYQLYNYKKDSASGRLFIWKVTMQMIKEKPVCGHGYDSYILTHNDYQAAYFERNQSNTEAAFLADKTTYAFNEFLQIASDIGVIGLMFFIFLFVSAFMIRCPVSEKNSPKHFIFIASILILLTFLVCSLFSYPLRSLPSHIMLYYALASISAIGEYKLNFQFHVPKIQLKLISYLSIILLSVFYIDQSKKFNGEKEWYKTFKLMRAKEYDQAYKNYKELYPVMQYNKYFLFNFGAELSLMQRYEKSIQTLNGTLVYLNDVDVYDYLGHSYQESGQLEQAEKCFLHASYIVPSKFFPKYNLVKLYVLMKKDKEAIALAEEIVQMKVKVPSELVTKIKTEMMNFLTLKGM
jgi:O-antigen ligase